MGIAIMLFNYFHDLAVAVLATNVLAIHFIGRWLDGSGVRDELMPALFARLSRITYIVLAYVVAAGGLRAWFFMEYEWNPAVGRGQVSAIVAKHVVLFAVTAFGLVAQTRYNRKYGKNAA